MLDDLITQDKVYNKYIKRPEFTKDEPQKILYSHYYTEVPDPNVVSEDNGFMEKRTLAKSGKNLKRESVLSTDREEDNDLRLKLAYEIIESTFKEDVFKEIVDNVENSISKSTSNDGYRFYVGGPLKDVSERRELGHSTNINFLSIAYKFYITDRLNEHYAGDDRNITFLDMFNPRAEIYTERTYSDSVGRIVNQTNYSANLLEEGDRFILVDDHVQAGGMFHGLRTTLKNKGVDIVAYSVLSAIPGSENLIADKQIIEMFEGFISDKTELDKMYNAVGKMGLTKETMSNREFLILSSYLMGDEDKEVFEKMKNIAGIDDKFEFGLDNINQLLSQGKKTADDFSKELHRQVSEFHQKHYGIG